MTSACGDQTGGNDETSNVAKKQPSVSTDAGGPYTLGANGKIMLSDTATLSDAFTPLGAAAKITFTLYADNGSGGCGTLLGSNEKAITMNGTVTSDPIEVSGAGTYHWIANFSGDDNNFSTSNTCNGTKESPLVINPSILITKDVNKPVVHAGDTVTYTIVVKNTGDSNLTNITVSDNKFPASCNRDKNSLPALALLTPGQSTQYTCNATIGTDDVTNTATATGTTVTGGSVNDDDDASVDVIHPHINVVKTLAAGQSPLPIVGTTVTFHIKVTNDGDTTLSNIVVTDPNAPDCNRNPLKGGADGKTGAAITLAPLASAEYDCTLQNVPITYTGNTATACGDDQLGRNVCDDDSVTVTPQPKQPAVDTNAGSTVRLGASGVDLTDTATLSGGTPNISGKIIFSLYRDGPSGTNCAPASLVATDAPNGVAVNNGNSTYSETFHVTQGGQYHWIANYTGDLSTSRRRTRAAPRTRTST